MNEQTTTGYNTQVPATMDLARAASHTYADASPQSVKNITPFRGVIFSPDKELGQYVHRVLADLGCVQVVRTLDRYPDQIELTRMLRAHAPQVVFVSIERTDMLVSIASHVEQVMPGVQVVAVGRTCDAQMLMEVMRAGVREFLTAPFDPGSLRDCLLRVSDNLSRRPVAYEASELLYSFLPAKPGVGATTLAINSSVALAKLQDVKGLLLDFDLNCGMVRFMLKLNSTYNIMDAAEHASNMDENLWPQIVTHCGQLDVVHAGSLNPELRIQNLQIQHLLDYSRRNYKVVCADLSGNLEKYSMEIMHESRRVFLVCTPEISSLHLAREKLNYLQRMDLGGKVCLLLNRHTKKGLITASEVEQIVGAPVMQTFPNDYSRVARAIAEGKPVEESSELGKACAELAGRMVEKPRVVTENNRRRFVEYFNISPAKFSFERSKP